MEKKVAPIFILLPNQVEQMESGIFNQWRISLYGKVEENRVHPNPPAVPCASKPPIPPCGWLKSIDWPESGAGV